MRKGKSLPLIVVLLFAAAMFMSSCKGIRYDSITVMHAQNVNKLADNLADKASTDYTSNTAQIQQLNDSLQASISYENGKGKTNFATTNMWKSINSYINTSFLATWSKDQKLPDAAFATELKTRLDKLFSYITNLEQNKIGGPLEQKTK